MAKSNKAEIIVREFLQNEVTNHFKNMVPHDPEMVVVWEENSDLPARQLAVKLKEKFDSRRLVQYGADKDMEVRLLFRDLAYRLKALDE